MEVNHLRRTIHRVPRGSHPPDRPGGLTLPLRPSASHHRQRIPVRQLSEDYIVPDNLGQHPGPAAIHPKSNTWQGALAAMIDTVVTMLESSLTRDQALWLKFDCARPPCHKNLAGYVSFGWVHGLAPVLGAIWDMDLQFFQTPPAKIPENHMMTWATRLETTFHPYTSG